MDYLKFLIIVEFSKTEYVETSKNKGLCKDNESNIETKLKSTLVQKLNTHSPRSQHRHRQLQEDFCFLTFYPSFKQVASQIIINCAGISASTSTFCQSFNALLWIKNRSQTTLTTKEAHKARPWPAS